MKDSVEDSVEGCVGASAEPPVVTLEEVVAAPHLVANEVVLGPMELVSVGSVGSVGLRLELRECEECRERDGFAAIPFNSRPIRRSNSNILTMP